MRRVIFAAEFAEGGRLDMILEFCVVLALFSQMLELFLGSSSFSLMKIHTFSSVVWLDMANL